MFLLAADPLTAVMRDIALGALPALMRPFIYLCRYARCRLKRPYMALFPLDADVRAAGLAP